MIDCNKYDRQWVVQQVRHWGGATADAILDPSMSYFSLPYIRGFIGYRLIGKVAIIFGDPTCPKEDKASLALAFREFLRQQGKREIYITVSQEFAEWAMGNISGTMIEFGEQLVLDPFRDPLKESGTYGSLVRRKVKQAIRENVTISEYVGSDSELEQKIERVGDLWLQKRKGMQLHISNIYQFEDREGKRWFYAQKMNQIVGVLTLNQLQSHQGWLLNHLMTTEHASNGTSELLITSTLETLKKEQCRYVTVGIVTNQELGKIVGLRKFSTWLAHQLFKLARKAVRLDGLNMFWIKFQPQRESSYLLFTRKGISLRDLMCLKRALSPKCSTTPQMRGDSLPVRDVAAS